MDYLLDTNIFLWWLNNDKRLKKSVIEKIENPDSTIFISVANAWEISIKHRKGKLPLQTTLKECIEVSNFTLLDITFNHILQLDTLPMLHADPFDRILIAQTKEEDLILITSDQKIWKYDISLLKA